MLRLRLNVILNFTGTSLGLDNSNFAELTVNKENIIARSTVYRSVAAITSSSQGAILLFPSLNTTKT
jgi:hypothetical protein